MPSKKKDNSLEPKHPSQMKFSDMLSQFVAMGDDDLGMADSNPSSGFQIGSKLIQSERKKKSKKEKDDGIFASMDFEDDSGKIDESSVDEVMPKDEEGFDDYDPTFDEFISKAFYDDEDIHLRNSLISLGRKYAIKGAEENAESSEVSRAFAKQEQQIGMLIDELNSDSIAVQKDIELLRMMRSKSYKSMADLISTKVAMSNAKLAAIKELSSIQKIKYDITLKIKNAKDAAAGDSGASASQAIQKLLSVGRANLTGSIDMAESSEDNDNYFDDGRAETRLEMMKDLPPADSDGDKFIEHEGEGVEYVLDIDRDTDTRQIYAVNKYGDVVSDYPLPSDPDQLSFSMNELTGEATDQLQRHYRIRYNGQDIGDRGNILDDEEEEEE